MKYQAFCQQYQDYPAFRGNILHFLASDIALIRRQLSEWVKQGKVWQLKRSIYTLPDKERNTGVSNYFLANFLYSPSYISLEYALSYYNLIPEKVVQVTSVTTKKTQSFTNQFATFMYHKIRTDYFFGYQLAEDEFGQHFYIAVPEKALLDLLYLRVPSERVQDKDFLLESYRLQNLSILNIDALRAMATKYDQKKIKLLTDNLITIIEREK